MKGFDVLHVKSAVKGHNKFDLSRTHLTTAEFGQILPLFSEEVIPGDKYNISSEFFSRLAPLVKPTYGKFYFKTVSAYVPYHQVAVDVDAFMAGKTVWEGQTPVLRHFTMLEFVMFLLGYCFESEASSEESADFVYTDTSGVVQYRRLSSWGKYYVKVLNSLGYCVPQGVDLQNDTPWMNNISGRKLCAYPLLAYFKLYNDYMSQSTRFNTSQLTDFLYCVKYGKSTSYFEPSTGSILAGGLAFLFESLFLCYDNDYFVSAWQNPNNPIEGQQNITEVKIPAVSFGDAQKVSSDNSGVFAHVGDGTSFTHLSQRALDFLRRFDDWVRRNNYSGSRSVQQIYSRFGIKTDDYRSHYAHVFNTDSMPIQVGDVTATADSANVPLGDYAGKGILSGNKSVYIECSDYGMIFILGYFTVKPMMSYGFDRRVLRTQPLDFYNPEFDGLGADAISVGEVYSSPIGSGAVQDDAVFGFTERYNSYRFGRDQITGDFRNFHNNSDMNTWHTGRNLSALRDSGNLVAQSRMMNTLIPTNSEYNRIFSVTSGDVDHFYLTAHFNVEAMRPMLSLNQVANLGEGDTTVPRNGNVIS